MNIDVIVNSSELENAEIRDIFSKWLKAADDFFEGKNICEALQDKKTLCKLFYIQSNAGLSRQKYQKNKRFIEILQKFYNTPLLVPSRDEALISREIISLYKSLDALLEFIDHVGKQCFKDYNPLQELLNIKSIAILGWHGFSQSQIASIEKESLKNDDGILGVQIDVKFRKILSGLASLNEYRGLPSGRLQRLRGNDKYLFRSIIADQTLTENHISDILTRFNRKAIQFSRIIDFHCLRKSALFVSIAEDAPHENLAHKIKNVFACEPKTVYGLETEYLLWYKDIYLN